MASSSVDNRNECSILRAVDAGLESWLPAEIARVSARDMTRELFVSRFLHRNIPVVIEGAARHWPAYTKWTPSYLSSLCGDARVSVNVTPDGWGDALAQLPRGQPKDSSGVASDATDTVFVAPMEVEMCFDEFLGAVYPERRRTEVSASSLEAKRQDALTVVCGSEPEFTCRGVPYLSHQNDNLRRQLPALMKDISGVPCLGWEGAGSPDTTAFSPDAINLWIGDSRSTSWLHKDHYENLYAVVRGRKEFILLPPLTLPGLYERVYRCGRYAWTKVPRHLGLRTGSDEEICNEDMGWTIEVEYESATAISLSDASANGTHSALEPRQPRLIPWISVNPAEPDLRAFPAYGSVSRHARTVSIGPGDILYLPSLWYHQVSQGERMSSGAHEDATIAVNAWFDMDFCGPNYAYYTALRAALGLP